MKYLIMAEGENQPRLEEFEADDDSVAKLHWQILIKERMPKVALLFRVDDAAKKLHLVQSARLV